jgi:hypothetical protein
MIQSEVFYSDGTKHIADYDQSDIILPEGWYYRIIEEDWSGPFTTKNEASVHLREYLRFIDSEPKLS